MSQGKKQDGWEVEFVAKFGAVFLAVLFPCVVVTTYLWCLLFRRLYTHRNENTVSYTVGALSLATLWTLFIWGPPTKDLPFIYNYSGLYQLTRPFFLFLWHFQDLAGDKKFHMLFDLWGKLSWLGVILGGMLAIVTWEKGLKIFPEVKRKAAWLESVGEIITAPLYALRHALPRGLWIIFSPWGLGVMAFLVTIGIGPPTPVRNIIGLYLLIIAVSMYLQGASDYAFYDDETGEKIIFGSRGESLSFDSLKRHVHVVGSTGSGKTVFLTHVTYEHIRKGKGFIFIDLKADADLFSRIGQVAKASGRWEDFKFFHATKPKHSFGYNPLKYGSATELKDKIVSSLTWSEEYYKSVSESVLLETLKAFVLLRDQAGEELNLQTVFGYLKNFDLLRSVQERLTKLKVGPERDSAIRALSTYLDRTRQVELARDLQGLRSQIGLLVEAEYGYLLTSGNIPQIDFLESIEKGEIVYILLDSQKFGESAKRLGKMILSDLRSVSSEIVSNGRRFPQTTIIVDEFVDLATDHFVGFLNRARGSGIGIMLAHQELSDLEVNGPTLRKQVQGNVGTSVVFNQKVPESAEIWAKTIGTKAAIKKTHQVDESFWGKGETGMTSQREVEEFIIHPNEFKRLPTGACIVIGKGERVTRAEVLPPPSENFESLGPELAAKVAPLTATVFQQPEAFAVTKSTVQVERDFE